MLFTNESPDKVEWQRSTFRDRLLRRILEWNLMPLVGIVRPAIAVAAYLALCLFFQALAPDFHLLPRAWSWNLAGGVSFGFLVAFGPAYVPAVFLAYLVPLVADGTTAVSALPVMVFAVGNSVAFGSASYIARRIAAVTDVDLENRRTLLVTLALIPFAALLAAFFSTMNWWFAGALLTDTFAEPLLIVEPFLIKAFGNGMGLLLVGPFVLLNGPAFLNKVVERSNLLVVAETRELVQGAALLHFAAACVVSMAIVGMDRFDVYLVLFVPLIAMALKFGLRGLAASFLAVGSTKVILTSVGYTALDGLPMETSILAALIGGLVVAVLATERARAVNTARRQAALIADAVARAQQETEVPEQEDDLKAVLNYLVQEVEASANVYGIENQNDEEQFERERLLERLEELIHHGDGGTNTGGVPEGAENAPGEESVWATRPSGG